MKRALVISIGTGTRPSEEAIDSLAGAIAFSILSSHPDKVFFVATKESVKDTLPRILQKASLRDYETIEVKDPDNIREIYEELRPRLLEIRSQYTSVVVDYTSGTKAMTGALVILGSLFEVDTLSYVAGKRAGGVVVRGTEELQTVKPYFVTCDKRIMDATRFFDECRFDTTLAIFEDAERITANGEILNRVAPLKSAAFAYSAWDKFSHAEAFEFLKTIQDCRFDRNKRFLGMLLHADEKEPYVIADLINNAKRRGDVEKKYDDAVGRLYRVIELMAQYRLKKMYKVDSSNVNPEDIPPKLREEWKIPTAGEKLRIGLERAWELLAAKGDELGEAFLKDEELKDLLSKRNLSILAHGLVPVSKEAYVQLMNKVLGYGLTVIRELETHLQDSKFVKLNE